MHFKISCLLSIVLTVNTIVTTSSKNNVENGPKNLQNLAEPKVTCVDTLADLEKSGFSQYTLNYPGVFDYAESAAELPVALQGKLAGNGIWHFEGKSPVQQNCLIYTGPPTTNQPNYMYVKYYSLVTSSSGYTEALVAPPIQHLPQSSNSSWRQELTPLKEGQGVYIHLKVLGFKPNDFFLLEKFALFERMEVNGIEHVHDLCGWEWDDDHQSTTTVDPVTMTTEDGNGGSSTTTTTPKTTTAPPSGFHCEESGYFADPEDCTVFHVCQPDNTGHLWDTVLECPETTVWCQDTKECEFPDTCPCPI